MRTANVGTAYGLWCLWLLGIGGAHRFYTGNIGMGILYFLTWGLFGFGQLIDLALIPGMVSDRNLKLKLLNGTTPGNQPPAVTVNIGGIPQAPAPQTPKQQFTPMQKLLRAAKQNGGTLSAAQILMATGLERDEAKQLVGEALREGYAEVVNDEKTGAVRYKFDV